MVRTQMKKIKIFFKNIIQLALFALSFICLPDPLIAKPRVIVLLGKPGSGKGTLAVQLKNYLKIPHISSGEVLKEHMRNGTEIGKMIKSYLDRGDFPPDDIFVEALFDSFKKKNFSKGCILDGFPRTTNQAELLSEKIGEDSELIAILLNLSDEKATERILNRRMCQSCFAPYNVLSAPPSREGICSICGDTLYQRPDDNIEVIKNRMIVYHKYTEPVLDYYHSKNCLYEINSDKPIHDILIESLDILGVKRGSS